MGCLVEGVWDCVVIRVRWIGGFLNQIMRLLGSGYGFAGSCQVASGRRLIVRELLHDRATGLPSCELR